MKLRTAFLGLVLPAIAGAGLAMLTRESAQPGTSNPELTSEKAKQLRSLSALPTQSDPRFRSKLESVEPAEFPHLIAELHLLPDHQRWIAIELAMTRWVRKDTAGALEYLASTDGSALPNNVLVAVFRTWASLDLEAAIESLDDESKDAQIFAILAELSKSDAARAWQIGTTEHRGAIDPFSGFRSEDLFLVTITEWLKQDPAAAIEAAYGWGERDCIEIILDSVGDRLSQILQTLDPKIASAVLEWGQERRPEEVVKEARALLKREPFSTDFYFLTSIPDFADSLSQEQLELIAEEVQEEGIASDSPFDIAPKVPLPTAMRILAEVEGAGADQEFVNAIALMWGEHEDPRQGLAWLETLSGSQREEARDELFASWQENDGSGLVEYLASTPPSEEIYRFALDDRINNYGDGDLTKMAYAWYESATSAEREALMEEMPGHVLQHDPEGVLRWSLDRQPDGEIDNVAVRSLDNWMSSTPEDALKWLQEASAETRDQFLARLEFDSLFVGFPITPADPDSVESEEPAALSLGWEQNATGFEMIEHISDPEFRERTLRHYVASGDAFLVQSALKHATISPQLRAEVQELIDLGETRQQSFVFP